MNARLVLGLTCLLLLNAAVVAQERVPESKLSDDRIIEKVSRFLCWNWYWEAHPVEDYDEGENSELAIVESPTETAAIVGVVGVWIVIDPNGKMIAHRTFRSTTNATAIDQYIAQYRAPSDLSRQPEHQGEITYPNFLTMGPQGNDTLTMEEKRKILKVRSIPFTLPKLEPPEAILLRVKSPELPRLKAAVPDALADWYTVEGCGKGQVVIPYFSEDDPWVDVYADLGGCGKGIVYFTHHDERGPWKFSQFWPNKPPDDFSSVIQKIRNNAADTVQLPAGLK